MKGLLTAEELADYLQVKVTTVNTWRWDGKGPRWIPMGPKNLVRYRLEDVDEWLEAQQSEHTGGSYAKGHRKKGQASHQLKGKGADDDTEAAAG